jgi:hypothetical protein
MRRCLHTPSQLRELALAVDAALSVGEARAPQGERTVQIAGEALVFPYRVYYAPDRLDSVARSLDGDARVFALCLASRHHDGRIREAAARDPHFHPKPWSIPFSTQLLGEYVVEIGAAVEDQMRRFGVTPFVEFARENPDFMEVTRRRAVSYWNCYYRPAYDGLQEYPCFRALQAIDSARAGR